jgi:3-deoxy-D-manno-octulosonate 8-phosphate phosphatase (KDO 8-P phosphatase)
MRTDALSMQVVESARNVRLLLMDCDGVLTDGRLYFTEAGEAMKVFNVRDGQGIANWHAAGHCSGIVTGRGAEAIMRRRVDELGMRYLRCGVKDKRLVLDEILADGGYSPEQVAYIGDDTGDAPVLRAVGLPVVVADCADDVAALAMWRTSRRGGDGAVRELIDMILGVQG